MLFKKWLNQVRRLFGSSSSSRPQGRRNMSQKKLPRLQLEFLEDRVVPAVLVVDTTSDAADGNMSSIAALLANKGADGHISLREAILAANNTANGASPDVIHFNIGAGGVQTITLASALPTITDPVTIDATTQPGFSGQPIIELRGDQAGANVDGLSLSIGGTTVRGLVLDRFSRDGIRITSSGPAGTTIAGNWIGLGLNGNEASMLNGLRRAQTANA